MVLAGHARHNRSIVSMLHGFQDILMGRTNRKRVEGAEMYVCGTYAVQY